MRIASLLASATEIVHALGIGDQLVAISHECDYPPEALDKPRVSRSRFDPAGMTSAEVDQAVRRAMREHGAVYELDSERLHAAAPDLILTQGVCEVCAVPTTLAEEAVVALEGRPEVLSLDAHTLDEILESIIRVGETAGVAARAGAYAAELRERMEAVRGRVTDRPARRVVAVEWLEPPFVPGHWVPEMFAMAGGVLLAGEVGGPSRETSWADLAGTDPDVLVVMPCGYGLEASRREADAHAAELQALASRAVEEDRAYVVDGSSFFNRSGPRVADGVELLGALLHPERFRQVDLTGRAERWVRKNKAD
jgi:iron complex transport system substrate-binding protein